MSAVSSTSSATSIQADYLSLLVTQLQNQDPLDPMDNNQMASQLTQLSQLQQTENMNSTFSKVLLSQQMTQATAMLGKTVTYIASGSTAVSSGTVSSVKVSDGAVTLRVGGTDVDLDGIQSVSGS